MGWNPLLSGAVRDRALLSAAALMRLMASAEVVGPRSASLASGSAGLAVCHAVAAQAGHGERSGDLAAASLDSAIEVLASRPLSLSLYSGFPGIAWAADLIGRLLPGPAGDRDDGDRDDGDRNDDIDQALAAAVARYPASGPYDLIDGLTGVGSYALARWPRPAAAECLAAVVGQLASRARADAGGVCWPTPAAALPSHLRQRYPGGAVDTGVAHGMAGVLPLLARACALGVGEDTARPLLEGAVRWLLGHLADSPGGATAPALVAVGVAPTPARSAWCYGDPGVALALLLAARDVGEPDWELAGTELALRAASRPSELTGVTDAGLCHGAAGLAHLFARMHQLTARPELAAAAVSWTVCTLDMCGPVTEGGGGLVCGPSAAWNGPGVLEGAAGIALALMAACLPAEPEWDQMLLVSTGLPAPVSA